MPSLMQTVLGQDWAQLPPALRAHYTEGSSVERGHLDIHFPRYLQPLFRVLHLLGALVHRRGYGVATEVRKQDTARGQAWQRRMHFADGQVVRFDSLWLASGHGTLIEYVNPLLAALPGLCLGGAGAAMLTNQHLDESAHRERHTRVEGRDFHKRVPRVILAPWRAGSGSVALEVSPDTHKNLKKGQQWIMRTRAGWLAVSAVQTTTSPAASKPCTQPPRCSTEIGRAHV